MAGFFTPPSELLRNKYAGRPLHPRIAELYDSGKIPMSNVVELIRFDVEKQGTYIWEAEFYNLPKLREIIKNPELKAKSLYLSVSKEGKTLICGTDELISQLEDADTEFIKLGTAEAHIAVGVVDTLNHIKQGSAKLLRY